MIRAEELLTEPLDLRALREAEKGFREVAYRQGSMPAPEFELWKADELPLLRWTRLQYLYANAPEKLKTLGGMLELIKTTPGHPSATTWLQEFRRLVTPASAAGGEPPAKPAI